MIDVIYKCGVTEITPHFENNMIFMGNRPFTSGSFSFYVSFFLFSVSGVDFLPKLVVESVSVLPQIDKGFQIVILA